MQRIPPLPSVQLPGLFSKDASTLEISSPFETMIPWPLFSLWSKYRHDGTVVVVKAKSEGFAIPLFFLANYR
jgi:hypothetical protein